MRIELFVPLDRPNYGLTVNPETVVLSRMVCSDKRMDEYRMTKCRPQIIEMYKDVGKKSLTLTYTASRKTKGLEMLAYSGNCTIPEKKYSAISIE